jgi:hypothetical protein
MGFTGRVLFAKDEFPAAEVITDLLWFYHTNVTFQNPEGRKEVAGKILTQTGYIIKKNNQTQTKDDPAPARAKLGVKRLSDSQREAVFALDRYCRESLKELFRPSGVPLETAMVEFFGSKVHEREAAEDAAKWPVGRMQWMTQAELKPLKLRFRGAGVAHRIADGNRLIPYDTDEFNDAVEFASFNLYVMDPAGHIYAFGQQRDGKELKHSSFLRGGPTMAAGTMRVKNGRILYITNQSGHYKPQMRQMLNVLERLQSYGVDLMQVQFCRTNFSKAWMDRNKPAKVPGARPLEPCNALEMLKERAFIGFPRDQLFIPAD